MVFMRTFGLTALVAVIGLVIVSCNRGPVSSASQSLPTTSTPQAIQSQPTTTLYSGTVQFGRADAGRTVQVVMGTEIDVLYPTAVSVANEDQASGAVTWISFRPGLIARFRATALGHARIVPTGSCPGMNCPPFELIVNVQGG
jgi:hypothetical protein